MLRISVLVFAVLFLIGCGEEVCLSFLLIVERRVAQARVTDLPVAVLQQRVVCARFEQHPSSGGPLAAVRRVAALQRGRRHGSPAVVHPVAAEIWQHRFIRQQRLSGSPVFRQHGSSGSTGSSGSGSPPAPARPAAAPSTVVRHRLLQQRIVRQPGSSGSGTSSSGSSGTPSGVTGPSTFTFSGYTWGTDSGSAPPVGNVNGNVGTFDPNNVTVGSELVLSLTQTQNGSQINSSGSEVITKQTFSYGTFEFTSRVSEAFRVLIRPAFCTPPTPRPKSIWSR